jgi:hypothetical protein
MFTDYTYSVVCAFSYNYCEILGPNHANLCEILRLKYSVFKFRQKRYFG